MNNLQLRILSALVLAPPVLAVVYLGFPYLDIFLAVVVWLLAWEWEKLCGNKFGVATIKIALFTIFAISEIHTRPTVAGIAILLGVVGAYWSSGRFNKGGSDPKWSALGMFYISLACVSLLIVRGNSGQGPETLFWLFAVVWGTDIGAYAFGRLLGGPLLAPSISPKKTWAGFAGGILTAVLLSIALAEYFVIPNLGVLLMATVVVSMVSQVGDLFESSIKRRFGAKDSGNIIPGHGGILDRVDGLMAAAPAAALLVLYFGGGVTAW